MRRPARVRDSAHCRYLILEGRAGYGAHNGECSVTPLPIATEQLSALLLDHVTIEKERKHADRNEAACLDGPALEDRAQIADRPTGLSAWIVGSRTIGRPGKFVNRDRALAAFLKLQSPQPIAAFSIEAVELAPMLVARFLIDFGQMPDGRMMQKEQ